MTVPWRPLIQGCNIKDQRSELSGIVSLTMYSFAAITLSDSEENTPGMARILRPIERKCQSFLLAHRFKSDRTFSSVEIPSSNCAAYCFPQCLWYFEAKYFTAMLIKNVADGFETIYHPSSLNADPSCSPKVVIAHIYKLLSEYRLMMAVPFLATAICSLGISVQGSH